MVLSVSIIPLIFSFLYSKIGFYQGIWFIYTFLILKFHIFGCYFTAVRPYHPEPSSLL